MSLRTRLAKASLALAAGGLAGCGFTPMYATPGVASDLAGIQVNTPHGRTAFLLHEALDDDFGRDRDRAPVYRLDLTLAESRYPRGLEQNNTADYYESHLTVTYRLSRIADGKVLLTGVAPVEASYAAADQPYANIAAQENAEQREADTAAQHIQIAVGAYFSRPGDH